VEGLPIDGDLLVHRIVPGTAPGVPGTAPGPEGCDGGGGAFPPPKGLGVPPPAGPPAGPTGPTGLISGLLVPIGGGAVPGPLAGAGLGLGLAAAGAGPPKGFVAGKLWSGLFWIG
jgi:hypothetical protein